MSMRRLFSVFRTVLGAAIFAVGFNMFLSPGGLNVGGLTGVSQAFVALTDIGTVGLVTAVMNIPLFIAGGLRIGKKFLLLSLTGALSSSVFIDLFSGLSRIYTEPLLGSVYGGFICGLGLGLVYVTGGSTGGSDIVVRLVKNAQQEWPIGFIATAFDGLVAVLSGVVTGDLRNILYSFIAIFVSGRVIDAVIYRFDYSRVALIISDSFAQIVDRIGSDLGRGATLLHGQGSYSRADKKIVLTAVKRQQMTELKKLVTDIDKSAFVIILEAHQVLGDGFLRYNGHSL